MSTLSYSRIPSFQNSRMSSLASNESFGMRRSNTMFAAFPATFSSNNLSGLSQLNMDVFKPLRIERIDRSTGTLKWVSSSSSDADHLKIVPDDLDIGKNRDVSNVNGVRMFGKNVIMTSNERRKTNQNNLEDKLLEIKKKELDRQSANLQQQIKRDRYKLLDQFLDSKAENLNFMKKNLTEDLQDMDLKTVFNSLENSTKPRLAGIHSASKSSSFKPSEKFKLQSILKPKSSNIRVKSASTESHDTQDRFKMNPIFNIQTFFKPNDNFNSNVTARFIEQKSKYFPSYLKKAKKTKISVSATEIDKVLEKAAVLNQTAFCTKHKKHRLAQIKADLYKTSKDLFGNDDQTGNDLVAEAEAALKEVPKEEKNNDGSSSSFSKRTTTTTPSELGNIEEIAEEN